MKALYLLLTGTLLSFSSGAQNLANKPHGNFGGDGTTAPRIQLNEDHTFVYTDLTRKSKPVLAEGTWSLESDELVLETSSGVPLNKRYLVIREGKCIKTRKGFAFYTLCNCK